jgi:peptidoglycan/LPS O-acetylase OafA/YrhL
LELQCYVALAFLGVVGILRWRWVVLALAAAGAIRYGVIEARGDFLAKDLGLSLEQHFLLEFGLFFAAGVVLQHFLGESARRRAMIMAGGWFSGLVAIQLGRPLLGLLLILPCTVICVATASTPILRRAGRFGDLSYGLYIFAFPIQQTLVWLNHGRLSWGRLFLVTLLACAAMAFASWHLVEKHALRLKPSRPQRAEDQPSRPRAEEEPLVSLSHQ